ncbi:MAG: signal recognition particle protein [Bacteroidetes bacterium]|nr:signal recognition particle protein [Bacteroidota bacterium]MDA1336379.1 signal recognition particle protein [Bacteroidota bacterium]
MFDNLQERFERAFQVLKGHGQITEVNVSETLKEVRKALLDADVDYKTAKEFTQRVKDKALGQKVLTAIKPGQLLIKITHQELTDLMGTAAAPFKPSGNPFKILMAGLQGAGKTTHSGKIAQLLRNQHGKKPLLVACDVHRPAAVNQLQVLGESIGIEVYAEPGNKDAVAIVQNAMNHAKSNGFNAMIVDTAGRLAIDEAMMQEIKAVREALQPEEILFTVDAMTGQDAVRTAKTFNEALNFTGVVLTKLDGDTRGGAALAIHSVVGKPIKFVGIGEKMDALDTFHPNRMADRILGMGDVVSLVEKAQQVISEKEAAQLEAKIRKNKFDLEDFLSQIQQLKKMGNIKDLMGMIPGMSKALKGIELDDNSFKQVECIIQSMTPDERARPEILDSRRKERIARGSGTDVTQVNRLLKQFQDMKKMMQIMTKGKGGKRSRMAGLSSLGR